MKFGAILSVSNFLEFKYEIVLKYTNKYHF